MHVLHRPHLPRLVSVSIAAAILTIVVSLALASSINQSGDNGSISVRHSVPASPSVLQTVAPRWLSDPFASLLSRPLPRPWFTPRG